ncbi:MAG: tetratricopeptide repeat protein, partial [Planctomycetota bacterium]
MQKVDLSSLPALSALAFCVLASMCSSAGAETVEVHMERGDSHYNSGDYQAALEEFQAATKIDPGYLRGWENMGWTYIKLGQADRAVDIWRGLKATHPDPSKLMNMIAQAYSAGQQYDRALAAYAESLEIEPGQKDVLAARCRVLYWAGRLGDAAVECRKFLSDYPQEHEIRQLLARLQMSQEIADYRAAIDNWQRLIAAEPNDPQMRIGLAKAYYRSESFQEAYESARDALELDAKDISVLEILISASIRVEQYKDAQDAVDRLRAIDPNHPDIVTGPAKIHYQKALSLYKDGNYESSLTEFLSAKALAPDLSRLSENIGWTYRRLGQVDEAIRIWRELLAARPKDSRILNLLAGAYADKRMFDEALLTYDKSLGIDPDQKQARFSRAKIRRWIGSYAESAEELHLLADEYPEDSPIRYELARCLVPLGRYDEAVKHYTKLVSAESGEPKYRLGLAKALYLCEQYDQALEIADDILAADPSNLDALDFMADDAEFLGDYKRTCQFLESALVVDANNVPRLNRLGNCAANLGDYPLVQKATEKSLRLTESQPTVRALYAHSLRINGHPDEAVKQYLALLACNPNHISAMVGLKEVAVA